MKYVTQNPATPNRAERRHRPTFTRLVVVSLTPKGKRLNAAGEPVPDEHINRAQWNFTSRDPRVKRREARAQP